MSTLEWEGRRKNSVPTGAVASRNVHKHTKPLPAALSFICAPIFCFALSALKPSDKREQYQILQKKQAFYYNYGFLLYLTGLSFRADIPFRCWCKISHKVKDLAWFLDMLLHKILTERNAHVGIFPERLIVACSIRFESMK